jgi:hypothetical protein
LTNVEKPSRREKRKRFQTLQPFARHRHLIREPSTMENIMHSLRSSPLLRTARRVLAGAALLAATTVFAGPPLICHPYDIGVAKSLPAGPDWHGVSKNYDRTHLVADTLAFLTPETPVLVRMETLRRAAIYATNGMKDWDKGNYTKEDRALGLGLLDQLQARVANAQGDARALALFDAGFFAETLRQTRMDPKLEGYKLIAQAAALRPTDAEIAFALAVASTSPQRKEHGEHLARARAAAKPGSLLSANIASHFNRS